MSRALGFIVAMSCVLLLLMAILPGCVATAERRGGYHHRQKERAIIRFQRRHSYPHPKGKAILPNRP